MFFSKQKNNPACPISRVFKIDIIFLCQFFMRKVLYFKLLLTDLTEYQVDLEYLIDTVRRNHQHVDY